MNKNTNETQQPDDGQQPKSSAFLHYMKAQSDRQTAYERYNYAGAALENAQIKERLAEIESQTEPLDWLLRQSMSERERLCAAAFYVVVGRMPNGARDLQKVKNQ
jgi:hypothetical protein